MPFEWKQFVDVSRHLQQEVAQGKANAEGLQRSAVSSAYYGAFCHARNYAVMYLGYKVKGFGDDHGALRAHLKKSRRGGDAQRLDSLRQWRNDADYADELPWASVAAVVEQAIKEAEKVFKSLSAPGSN
jgi:hypothetical protein